MYQDPPVMTITSASDVVPVIDAGLAMVEAMEIDKILRIRKTAIASIFDISPLMKFNVIGNLSSFRICKLSK